METRAFIKDAALIQDHRKFIDSLAGTKTCVGEGTQGEKPKRNELHLRREHGVVARQP